MLQTVISLAGWLKVTWLIPSSQTMLVLYKIPQLHALEHKDQQSSQPGQCRGNTWSLVQTAAQKYTFYSRWVGTVRVQAMGHYCINLQAYYCSFHLAVHPNTVCLDCQSWSWCPGGLPASSTSKYGFRATQWISCLTSAASCCPCLCPSGLSQQWWCSCAHCPGHANSSPWLWVHHKRQYQEQLRIKNQG